MHMLLLLLYLSIGKASVLELSGRLETKSFMPLSGELNWSSMERFTMETDGTRYRLRFAKPEKDMAKDYVEVAFDGTNTYYLNAMLGWYEIQRSKGATIADNVATAFITRTPVPQFPFAEQASVLWCAYVAPSHMKQFAQKALIHTPFSTGMKGGATAQPGDFKKFPALWTFRGTSTRYIDELCYLNNGGFTNAIYRTLEWSSDELSIPVSGRASTFAFEQQSSWQIFEFSFILDAYTHKDTVPTYTPAIPGLTSVVDERFNDLILKDFHFMYSVNSNWLSLDDAKRTPGYLAAAQVSRTKQTQIEVSKFWRVFFVLVVISLIVLVWRHRQLKAR